MNINNFIIILIAIFVLFYVCATKENFTSNSGLYNYFFQLHMNPYPLPLNKFFSNDEEEKVNK